MNCCLLYVGYFDSAPTRVTSDYRTNLFRFFRQTLELKQQYTQTARCGSEINFHVITKPEINRTREISSCITESSLNPTSATTRTKYMKLCLVHVSHEIGHVMMTPLQSPHTPSLATGMFHLDFFQQSGSNANDRLVTIHMHLSQRDFESYKEHKTTKRIGTWNQSWYVACQNRHVLHTTFTSKTYHQNPGIRDLFSRIPICLLLRWSDPIMQTPNHQVGIFDRRKWLCHYSNTRYVNMFRFEQNGHHVADSIFKLIYL